MKQANVLVLIGSAAISQAHAPYDNWSAPGPNDVRGPCPMLNTLANHDILPHSGKDIDSDTMVEALHTGLNMEPDFTKYLFSFAVQTNPEPNADKIDLNHLTRHNILEHDASLSRVDAHFGPADVFDAETYAETQSYWSPTITLEEAARSRVARFHTSNKTNPEYEMSNRGRLFSLGEVAGYIEIFGDWEALTAPKKLIDYWFQNERLPTELGWDKPAKMIMKSWHNTLMYRLQNITDEIDPTLGGQWPDDPEFPKFMH